MSYNISRFRVDRLEGLKVPLSAFTNHDLYDVRLVVSDNSVDIGGLCEMFGILGKMEDNNVVVSSIRYGGEGSGWGWGHFKELLKQSVGELDATIVWEGGDTLEYMFLRDGDMKFTKI